MSSRSPRRPANWPAAGCRQRGAALLLSALLLVLGVFGYLLASQPMPFGLSATREAASRDVLARAKEALIARSAASSIPGQLVCPEDPANIGTANEGNARSSCTSAGFVIGRLPWRSLDLEKLVDAYGEPLWYVLSPGFRQQPINSETAGQIGLDSQTGIVALVIAPGPLLPGQARTAPSASQPPNAEDYLDLTNATGSPSFVSTGTADQFNDRVIAITHTDLFGPIERRVAREVRQALLEHFCGTNNMNVTTGGCLSPTGGVRNFPAPAAIADTNCLGNAPIPTNCVSDTPLPQPSPLFGRLPANPSGGWEPPASSILRGQTGGSPPNWFQRNRWRELVFYSVSQKCIEGTANCNGAGDKITLHLAPATDDSAFAAIIVAGAALASQSRASNTDKTARTNYLEAGNASGTSELYVLPTGSSFNDILEKIRFN